MTRHPANPPATPAATPPGSNPRESSDAPIPFSRAVAAGANRTGAGRGKGQPRDWIFVQLARMWYTLEHGWKLNQAGELYDMSGAPAVIGTFASLDTLELPFRLVGLVPSAENVTDAMALKPGQLNGAIKKSDLEKIVGGGKTRVVIM